MLISGHPCPNDCSPLRFWHSPCFCLWPEACLQGGLAALVLLPSGVALALRPITRPRTYVPPLTCSGSLGISWSVGADCFLWDFGSIFLEFYVMLLKQGRLCWHTLAIWERFGRRCWQPCLCCCVWFLPQAWSSPGPGDCSDTEWRHHFLLPPTLSARLAAPHVWMQVNHCEPITIDHAMCASAPSNLRNSLLVSTDRSCEKNPKRPKKANCEK